MRTEHTVGAVTWSGKPRERVVRQRTPDEIARMTAGMRAKFQPVIRRRVPVGL